MVVAKSLIERLRGKINPAAKYPVAEQIQRRRSDMRLGDPDRHSRLDAVRSFRSSHLRAGFERSIRAFLRAQGRKIWAQRSDEGAGIHGNGESARRLPDENRR